MNVHKGKKFQIQKFNSYSIHMKNENKRVWDMRQIHTWNNIGEKLIYQNKTQSRKKQRFKISTKIKYLSIILLDKTLKAWLRLKSKSKLKPSKEERAWNRGLEGFNSYMINSEIIVITMELNVTVIPLPFEQEKRVSLWTFLNFIVLLKFILDDGFMKLDIEKGNMQR